MYKTLLNALILVLAVTIPACGDNKGQFSQNSASLETYDTEDEARANSPVGLACLYSGELKEECVPTNRGKNGNCENQIIDNRQWTVAYLRGDTDNDGSAFTRADIQLAKKRIYVKQIESEPCPAVADLADKDDNFFSPDGYFTSSDLNNWQAIFKGVFNPLAGEIVCQQNCAIVNHMEPTK